MLRPAVVFIASLAFALAGPPSVAGGAPGDFVVVREGSLPIIITAPHGGIAAIPGVPQRSREGRKGPDYVFGIDGNTNPLALAIADEIKALTGKQPYVVVARFDRKYIDANRPASIAFDDPKARPYYDHYHGTIRRFVDEVRTRYPAGILLDVHGQVKMNDSLLRGTANGRTVTRLVTRKGFDAITGSRGLFGQLEAAGFKVFPSNSLPTTGRHEDAGFNGGYTTRRYGSDNADGIDSVQLEFGGEDRSKERLAGTARKAARAIVDFHESYLK